MTLLNIENTRQLIRSFFNSTLNEIFQELLQNSQRGKASLVNVKSISDRILEFTDNGDGIKDMSALLTIGSSSYNPKTMRDQHPLGIGFYGLLAHEDVEFVEIYSNNQYLKIDVERWWADRSYAESWEERVHSVTFERGTTFLVTAKEKFMNALHRSLDCVSKGYYLMDLKIQLEEETLDNGYNYDVQKSFFSDDKSNIITVKWKGNRLYLKTTSDDDFTQKSWVNHYGQMILVESEFKFFLEINKNSPLDFIAPSRNQVIANEKWNELISFLKKKITNNFSKRKRLSGRQVELFYRYANEEQKQDFPWIFTGENCFQESKAIEKKMLRSNFLIDRVVIWNQNAEYEYVSVMNRRFNGLHTFGSDLLLAPENKISGTNTHTLVWRVEDNDPEEISDIHFFNKGEYCLVNSERFLGLDSDQISEEFVKSTVRDLTWNVIENDVFLSQQRKGSLERPLDKNSCYYPIYFGSAEACSAFESFIDNFKWDNAGAEWDICKSQLVAQLRKGAIASTANYHDYVEFLGLEENEIRELAVFYLSPKKVLVRAHLANGEQLSQEGNIV